MHRGRVSCTADALLHAGAPCYLRFAFPAVVYVGGYTVVLITTLAIDSGTSTFSRNIKRSFPISSVVHRKSSDGRLCYVAASETRVPGNTEPSIDVPGLRHQHAVRVDLTIRDKSLSFAFAVDVQSASRRIAAAGPAHSLLASSSCCSCQEVSSFHSPDPPLVSSLSPAAALPFASASASTDMGGHGADPAKAAGQSHSSLVDNETSLPSVRPQRPAPVPQVDSSARKLSSAAGLGHCSSASTLTSNFFECLPPLPKKSSSRSQSMSQTSSRALFSERRESDGRSGSSGPQSVRFSLTSSKSSGSIDSQATSSSLFSTHRDSRLSCSSIASTATSSPDLTDATSPYHHQSRPSTSSLCSTSDASREKRRKSGSGFTASWTKFTAKVSSSLHLPKKEMEFSCCGGSGGGERRLERPTRPARPDLSTPTDAQRQCERERTSEEEDQIDPITSRTPFANKQDEVARDHAFVSASSSFEKSRYCRVDHLARSESSEFRYIFTDHEDDRNNGVEEEESGGEGWEEEEGSMELEYYGVAV